MKVTKLYAEFVVKFPKFNTECIVVLDYVNKFFIVYFGNELKDEDYAQQYADLRKRFKVDDNGYTCKWYHTFASESIHPKSDIYDLVTMKNLDAKYPALKELANS